VPGGLIWTYAAGTTTPLVTYADNQLAVPNTNPIVADGSGRWTAYAQFAVGYKLVFETPAVPPAHGATIKTCDNIVSPLTELTNVDTGGATYIIDNSATGAVNNYVLVGRTKSTVWQWSGTADLLLTGIAGGAFGHLLWIKNVAPNNTNRRITFAHSNGSSLPINQFYNAVTLTPTPIAPMGWVLMTHNGSGWVLIDHDQGSWLTRPFSAANYSTNNGTWTVSNAARDAYLLVGKTLHYAYNVGGTSSNALASQLLIVCPGGFSNGAGSSDVAIGYHAPGGVVEAGIVFINSSTITLTRISGANWPASTNNVAGQMCFEVT
jgi:hypothetical protein